MSSRSGETVRVEGYVAEIVCGFLPRSAKEIFTRHIVENRDASGTAAWVLKRFPNYVSPEDIKRIWYEDPLLMKRLMALAGLEWRGFQDIGGLFSITGFGGGREGLGLFEIGLFEGDRRVFEFVPYDPPEPTQPPTVNMASLPVERLAPPVLPDCPPDRIMVSAGTWSKGFMAFPLPPGATLDPGALALRVVDLTPIGIGEDHFVAGLTCGGIELRGQASLTGPREGYPVTWYSPVQNRWMEMYESV